MGGDQHRERRNKAKIGGSQLISSGISDLSFLQIKRSVLAAEKLSVDIVRSQPCWILKKTGIWASIRVSFQKPKKFRCVAFVFPNFCEVI